MARTEKPLLAQIGSDALDDRVPLTTALRKCISLGGEARSDELRDWASKELEGYREGDLPKYRSFYVPLLIDAVFPTGQVRGQQISKWELPDFARDAVTEELLLVQGVGELQALVRDARAAGKTAIQMAPPDAAELLTLWNQRPNFGGGGQIMRLYWDVNVARIEGVLEQIRNTLVRLVSEMRATMPADSSVPSPESAASAVNVVLHGGKRSVFNVNTAVADNGASASVSTSAEHKDSFWTKTTAIWTVVIAVIAAVTLYLSLK